MPLTWQQLAESDDFLSKNLIDNVFFWIETRKVHHVDDNETLVIGGVAILKLLRKYVIDLPKPNVTKCVNKLISLQNTKYFLKRFQDQQVVLEFKKHARKYIELYLPECGFDICTTDRYKSKSGAQEACIIAKQEFNTDDEIKFLQGTFAELDADGEAQLDKNDFSVFNTTSNTNSKLMLGPCRFVNHSCEANCKFSPSFNGVKIIAIKRILPGEEITVGYSPSYFGKDNKDCLCTYCELNHKGYYDPERFVIPESAKLIDISSSEEQDVDVESEPEVIVIEDTDDEVGKEEETISDEDDGGNSDSDDLVPLDSNDFPGEIPDSEIRGKLKNLRHRFDEPFQEPESEVVGGRRLRPRLTLKSSKSFSSRYSILMHYLEDKSFDSLLIENRDCDPVYMKKRRIQRTLHKLYMTSVYKHETFEFVFDCRHCGVYFELELLHEYKEYCHRCTRHQKIYGFAWPFTRDHEEATSLVLDSSVFRYDIQDLINRNMSGNSDGGSSIRRRLHGGIVLPVFKNPRDLKNPISLKRFRDSENSRSSQEESSNSAIKSRTSSPITTEIGSKSPTLPNIDSESLKRLKITNGYTDKFQLENNSLVSNVTTSTSGKTKLIPMNGTERKLRSKILKNEFRNKSDVTTKPYQLMMNEDSDEEANTPPTISEILNSKPKVNPQALAKTAKERNGWNPEDSLLQKILVSSPKRASRSHHSSSAPEKSMMVELDYYSSWVSPLVSFHPVPKTISRETNLQNPKPNSTYRNIEIFNVPSSFKEELIRSEKTREFKVPEEAEFVILDSD